MFVPPRAIRIFAAALVGVAFYLFWAFPAWLAPTLAVAVFVLVSYLLGCESPWLTVVFASLMALIPVLLFAAGLSVHTSIAKSLSQSVAGFASQLELLLWFMLYPFIVGALLHFLLYAYARRSIQR